MTQRTMYRQVAILASAQALFQIASVMVMTIGGVVGAQLASDPRWATLPIAAMFLGTATLMFPASLWMERVGRRIGFLCGALLGAMGGGIAILGILNNSLFIFSCGTFLVGTYQAFAQFYRFAASEVATDSFRPRAISLVMAGGIVAAVTGPWLAKIGGSLLSAEYVGSFLILALVSLVAGGILMGIHSPVSTPVAAIQRAGSKRPWQKIVSQPVYFVALYGALTGYGVMILAMTATPIAMKNHSHLLESTVTVIQLHVFGMFAPSFFTGALIARFGVIRIMMVGVLLFIGHVLMTLTGTGFESFLGALILLGVGWNFMYIGGTTLLTQGYTQAEKSYAQAINDMTIFVVGLICSFSAGGLLNWLGWQTLNLALLPWLICALMALAWLSMTKKIR